jgi:acyl carrier protein
MNEDPARDRLVEQILDVFAREARIERSRLRLDVRASDLGVASLDLALALFELEDQFDIELPDTLPDAAPPTVGELVQQVLERIERSRPTEGAA